MSPKATPQENIDETPEAASLESSWVFVDAPATLDEVKALLASVTVPFSGGRGPSSDGISQGPELAPLTMDRYMPYVLPMSNNVKVKVPDANNPQRTNEEHHVQTTLYTQVAGRLAILADVAERKHWDVDVYPEPTTPTGVPGYLQMDERLVFRVYVEISVNGRTIGKRFGTAWAKAQGGFNAEGSNPYETVETSALGRALAQWGFGILPGSGIASVEEMRLARQNIGGTPRGARGSRGAPAEATEREDRGDLITSAITKAEELRAIRGMTQDQSDEALAKWILDKFGIEGFVNSTGGYEWQLLTDAQIAFLRNTFRDAVAKAKADAEMGGE